MFTTQPHKANQTLVESTINISEMADDGTNDEDQFDDNNDLVAYHSIYAYVCVRVLFADKTLKTSKKQAAN